MTNLERLQPQWLLPIRPSATLLTDHDLIHQSGRIVDLLPRQAASTQYPNANILPLPGKVLMPGLVNCHGHAAMTLLRGYADDYKLMTWLNDYIWPVEAKVVCAAFVEIGAWLAATEMIQSGTTCAAVFKVWPPPPLPILRFLFPSQAAKNPVGIAPHKPAQQGAKSGPQLTLALLLAPLGHFRL